MYISCRWIPHAHNFSQRYITAASNTQIKHFTFDFHGILWFNLLVFILHDVTWCRGGYPKPTDVLLAASEMICDSLNLLGDNLNLVEVCSDSTWVSREAHLLTEEENKLIATSGSRFWATIYARWICIHNHPHPLQSHQGRERWREPRPPPESHSNQLYPLLSL